jgi:hypothetical protein
MLRMRTCSFTYFIHQILGGTSAIHRLQERLCFNQEGSICNISIERGVPMNLFRTIKLCLNGMYNKFRKYGRRDPSP